MKTKIIWLAFFISLAYHSVKGVVSKANNKVTLKLEIQDVLELINEKVIAVCNFMDRVLSVTKSGWYFNFADCSLLLIFIS